MNTTPTEKPVKNRDLRGSLPMGKEFRVPTTEMFDYSDLPTADIEVVSVDGDQTTIKVVSKHPPSRN